MVCSMAQLPPVQFPREFHGRSPGLSSTSKAAGSTSQIFTWGWWITVALQLIGLSENYRTCTYVYTWKKYIYIYIHMKNYHIYIHTENMFMEIYHMYIYIHTFIYKKIYRKKNEGCHGKTPSFPTSTNSGWNQSIDSFVKLSNLPSGVIKQGLLEMFPFSSMCFPAINLHVWWIFSCHVWLPERILYMCIYTCKCCTSPNTILDENRAPLQSATIVTSAFWPVERQFQPTRCAWKIELPPFLMVCK